MLSLGSTEPLQTSPSPADGELSLHLVESAPAPASRETANETRRAPFDMSEFPALAGHASLSHGSGRESHSEPRIYYIYHYIYQSIRLSNEAPGFSIPYVDSETAVESLASSDLHRFPSDVLNNEDLAGRRQLLQTSLEYSQDRGSNFAMQSEDFPALPGTQRTTVSFGSENMNADASSEVIQHAGLHFEPTAKSALTTGEECYSENSFNQGATMRALNIANLTHPESTSKNPRVLRENSVTFSLSTCIPHLDNVENKGSVVSVAPVLASRSIGAPITVSSCTSNPAFDRVPEVYNDILLDGGISQPSRDINGFGGMPEQRVRPLSRLNVSNVGLMPPSNIKEGKSDTESQTKYGLLGLLDVIRMTNADLNTLALGSDLTTLGLNLNSSECLYSTFASPWADAPTTREPQFTLPLCYYMQPPPLKTSHLSKFQLETLFYIFYAMPKDVLQAYAAQELYNREWQYHQDLKLWFKRGSSADGLNFASQYIFFDIKTWECRVFSNMHTAGNLSNGLLHEDNVRVKFVNTS
mmetsp:Transcript_27340/g.84324  ORF Transcript_27340/g.84324 Transcript_27340/m.84324 type:complete len:527 (+) Transcript_27340:364-1944(+)